MVKIITAFAMLVTGWAALAPTAGAAHSDATFQADPHATVEAKESQAQATQPGAIKEAAFPVVAFVREVELSFPQSPDRVCPLFDPRTRPDPLGIQRVETLYEPKDGTLKGLTLRIGFRPGARAHGNELTPDRFSTTVVIHHDIDAGVLKYLNIYANIEDEQITVTCVSNAHGGTVATFQNRILGFHKYGVKAVTDYVGAGGVESSALQWRNAIMERLEK